MLRNVSLRNVSLRTFRCFYLSWEHTQEYLAVIICVNNEYTYIYMTPQAGNEESNYPYSLPVCSIHYQSGNLGSVSLVCA